MALLMNQRIANVNKALEEFFVFLQSRTSMANIKLQLSLLSLPFLKQQNWIPDTNDTDDTDRKANNNFTIKTYHSLNNKNQQVNKHAIPFLQKGQKSTRYTKYAIELEVLEMLQMQMAQRGKSSRVLFNLLGWGLQARQV